MNYLLIYPPKQTVAIHDLVHSIENNWPKCIFTDLGNSWNFPYEITVDKDKLVIRIEKNFRCLSIDGEKDNVKSFLLFFMKNNSIVDDFLLTDSVYSFEIRISQKNFREILENI